MINQKFGLLGYWSLANNNLGDYVQAIAARQFLPAVDIYCEREKLKSYNGNEIRMIMNGWFMHNPKNFPPSDKITPIYISMHINSTVYNDMTNEECIVHFKKYEPIGCRDINTERLLAKKGIKSYFSGCLTLTLGRLYQRNHVKEHIVIVDPLYNLFSYKQVLRYPALLKRIYREKRFKELNYKNRTLTKFLDPYLLKNAEFLTQDVRVKSIEEGLKKADAFLKKLCEAKLVITSRIHCALPCLAMGTPVIFINAEAPKGNDEFTCRFSGLLEMLNVITVSQTGGFTFNFECPAKITESNIPQNKSLHVPYIEKLVEQCIAIAS